MVLEWLVGLDGNSLTAAGLYVPYQLLDPTACFARLQTIGGTTMALEVP